MWGRLCEQKKLLPALQSKVKNAEYIKSCLIQVRDNTQRLIGQKVSDAKKKLRQKRHLTQQKQTCEKNALEKRNDFDRLYSRLRRYKASLNRIAKIVE